MTPCATCSPGGRRFAIVGAGPSGLYAAERLLRADPDIKVDVFERLPIPFGLVRYGVAPDHQITKNVTRVLERTLDKPNLRFFGNVEIGHDVSLDSLRAAYDGVLLTVGACIDRKLDIPGARLPNVVGSWQLIAWINGHPGHGVPVDFADVQNIIIVGLGNVAIDAARLLLKPTALFEGSDLTDEVAVELARASIKRVAIIGRGGIDAARFGRAELAELVALPDLSIETTPVAELSDGGSVATVLREASTSGPRRLSFHFGVQPVAIEGWDRVTNVRVRAADGVEDILPADLVVTCIGYGCAPFCELQQEGGRFIHDGYRVGDGLYVGGWAATGPRGTIAASRTEAHAVADRMLAETVAGDASGLAPSRATDLAAWRRIDAAELAAAAPGRCRAKIITIDAMLKLARQKEEDHEGNGMGSIDRRLAGRV